VGNPTCHYGSVGGTGSLCRVSVYSILLSLIFVFARTEIGQCDELFHFDRQTAESAAIRQSDDEELIAPEPSVRMTLAALEQMALENNRAIREALAKVEAARGNWLQVGLPPNPFVGYSGQQLGSHGLAEQNGVLIGQEFVRGQKLRLNRSVAEREIALAEQQAATVRQRALTDVHMAYYEAIVAEQRLELNGELVKIGTESLRAAESLFRAQTGSQVDVLQAQIEVEQARILLQNAGNRRQAAWQSLSAVVGQPLPVQRLEGTLDRTQLILTWEDTLGRLLGQSPEVAAAAVNVERAQQALRRARAEPTPNITVEGIVQYDNAIDSSDGNLQVTLPVPLLNRNQGGIREARARLAGAQQALERVEAGLNQRLATVFERYANAQNQVGRYSSEILPAAERSFELTRQGYRSGEFGFLTLLTALRTLFHTKLAYLEAQRELCVSASEIEGMLLTNSLETAP